MSSIGSYPVRQFNENQKFLVQDPSTSTASLVLGSDLVNYILPNLNSVLVETTRTAAQNTDYSVGTVVRTTGDTAVADGLGTTYLVVAGGTGNYTMLNGNDLLAIPVPTERRVIPYESLADVIASVDLLVGQRVSTAGYYTSGDGGGNDYEIVAGGTGTADGGSFIDLDNGLQARGLFKEHVSVLQFGAGSGADQTTAFSNAAKFAPAGNAQTLQKPDIPMCDWAYVVVPDGDYTLTGEVDTGNKEIVWLADVGAVITGFSFINGRLYREGSKSNDFHHGTHDQAITQAFMANRSADEISQISGFTNPNQLSKGNGRDSVTMYFGNRLPGLTYNGTSATYTATTAAIDPAFDAAQLRKLRKGMIVHTEHGTPYAAYLESWTSDSITVKDGWFLVDGSDTGTPATPPDGPGVLVNYFRKAFTLNSNTFIDPSSYGDRINGFELGIQNTKDTPTLQGGTVEANGMFCVNLSSSDFDGDRAFFTGGKWERGIDVRGGSKFAFHYDGAFETVTNELTALLFAENANGNSFYHIKRDGTVEQGVRGGGVATPVYQNFHSSGEPNDYDVRFRVQGGNASSGNGELTIYSTATRIDSRVEPFLDNTYSLGRSGVRWSEVFAATGTINTSDERTKQQWTSDLSPELRAWAKVEFGKFKYNDAVEKKGKDGARWHFGVIAQQVKDAFESEGLDPFDYGILCYDEWEDEWEEWDDEYKVVPAQYSKTEKDEEGNPKLIKAAYEVLTKKAGKEKTLNSGSLYGVRYEEALCLEAALMREEIKAIKADKI